MFFQQNIKPYLTRHKMFLPLLALVFCCAFVCGGQARAEEVWDEAAIVAARAAPCKGLKPFNNIDELLYQFYINLDSDCLFNMSVAELEEVWGIEIYQVDRRTRDKEYEKYVLERTELFWDKPYNSEKDAFVVQVDTTRGWGDVQNTIDVFITQAYFKKYCTLFPEGNYPKLLPPPEFEPMAIVFPDRLGKPKCTPEKQGDYKFPTSTYNWYSSWFHPATLQLGEAPQRVSGIRVPHWISLRVMLEGVTEITVR